MRVAVDDDPVVTVASVARGEAIKTVLVVNRGPDDVFVEFDGDAVAATSFQMKVDDYVTRKIGRGQKITAICAAGKTATLHVVADPEE